MLLHFKSAMFENQRLTAFVVLAGQNKNTKISVNAERRSKYSVYSSFITPNFWDYSGSLLGETQFRHFFSRHEKTSIYRAHKGNKQKAQHKNGLKVFFTGELKHAFEPPERHTMKKKKKKFDAAF